MAALPGAMGREERGGAPSRRVAVDYTSTGRTILMTDDLNGITKLPEEGARWIDEPLRGAIRELRTVLLSRADGGVPAAREAWTEAAQMVVAIMQQHGIEFGEPPLEQIDINPEMIERLLDEAELSPGPITPAARAMLAILRWLLVTDEANGSRTGSEQFSGWARRATALYDRDEPGSPEPGSSRSWTPTPITDAAPELHPPPPAPDNPIGRD